MLKNFSHKMLAFLALLLPSASLSAQDAFNCHDDRKEIPAQKASTAPQIDGVMSAGEWKGAYKVNDMHTIRPVDNGVPSLKTDIYVFHDSDNLYVAARMYDDRPESIRGRVMIAGSDLSGDDAFKMVLSPYNNGQSGYFFKVNVNGVRQDALFEGANDRNFDWDAIWYAQSGKEGNAWVTEIAIPFKSISFDPKQSDWGISFGRDVQRLNEKLAWTSFDRRISVDALGVLQGVKGANQGIGLDIAGSLVAKHQKDYETGDQKFEFVPSVDVFYKITPSLTAVMTANTDFSATDIDDQVVNLSRFSIFIPEKRDFFLQDADIFKFGSIHRNGMPFFSRTIGLNEDAEQLSLRLGGKLTGRLGKWDVGVLDVVQEKDGGGNTNLFVGRVQRRILENSRVGLLVTHGDPISGESSYTIGADFNFRSKSLLDDRVVETSVWALKSHNEGLVGDDKSYGYRLALPTSDGLFAHAYGVAVEENFDPALGFVNRPGVFSVWNVLGYTWRSSGDIIDSNRTEVKYGHTKKIGGGIENSNIVFSPFSLRFKSEDHIHGGVEREREVLSEPFEIIEGIFIPVGDYSFNKFWIGGSTARNRKYGTWFGFSSGDYYTGKKKSYNIGVRIQPSPRLKVFARMDVNDIRLAEGEFKTKLYKVGADIAFNSSLSWKTNLQYDNISQSGGINSKLRYNPKPGQDVYLIVNHGVEKDDLTDRFQSVENNVALKVGYTMRF